MNKIYIYITIALLCSCSAGMADMAPGDYINWYKENTRVTLTHTYGEKEFRATYKTPELIYLLEKGRSKPDRDELEKRKKELGDLVYFNFKIKLPQSNDLFASAGLNDVNYPLDLMQNEFYLVQNSDTARCVLFHFERTYGLSPETDISLAFDPKKIDRKEDFTFVYNDELFRTGINKFLFTSSSVNSVPILRL